MSPAQVHNRHAAAAALGRVMKDRNVQLRLSSGQKAAIVRGAVTKVETRKREISRG